MNPLVSIIIDNYNYGRFLKEAIDSAIHQTYSPVQVIVVDDGSTDNSREVIDEYGNKIKSIFKENAGQASAFNVGFAASTGDIIIFLDSDDELHVNTLEKAVRLFKNIQVVKVHWPMWVVNAETKNMGQIIPKDELSEGDLLELLTTCGPGLFNDKFLGSPTSGNAFRRQYLEEVFPISEVEFRTGGIDYYLFVLSTVFGKCAKLAEPGGYYRVHGSNDTSSRIEDYIAKFDGWYEKVCIDLSPKLQEKGINIKADEWPRNSWFHRINESIKEIKMAVPEKASFILVDDEQWRTTTDFAGRKRIPFIEKDGQYWGHPANDEEAIAEIERLKSEGAEFIFFAWVSFWWLDYYSVTNEYLRYKYECVVSDNNVIGFNLMEAQ